MMLVYIGFLLYLGFQWYWIKNDSQYLQALVIMYSFLGAITGGLAGGLGSYLGGVEGAKINFNLLIGQQQQERHENKEKHRRLILNQLKYTYEILSDSFAEVEFKDLLYDDNWHIHLVECDLDQKDKDVVFAWFKKIKFISNGYGFLAGRYSEPPIKVSQKIDGTRLGEDRIKFHFGNQFNDVKIILGKY